MDKSATLRPRVGRRDEVEKKVDIPRKADLELLS